MTKADKMFGRLGYTPNVGVQSLYTNRRLKKYEYVAKFDSITFIEDGRVVIVNKKCLTMKEHLAIHEKLKELGWIDE